MTPAEARELLRTLELDDVPDFHALSSDQVHAILDAADQHKYRQPKDANGSRARYFYAFLLRQATPPRRGDDETAHYRCEG